MTPPLAPVAPSSRGNACVLLVDDDVLSQEVGIGMLGELALRVVVAADGAEAVRLATAGGIDLILMDVQMPVMDGLSATRAIRAIPGCAALPIIAMSANAFPEDRLRCLAAGMNAHVAKPVDFDNLCRELARWLPVDAQPLRAEPCGSVPAQIAGAVSLIDTEAGLRYFSGREDAYHRMLQRFALLRSGDAALAAAALAAGSAQQAGRIAHSLKSMAATLGITALRDASAKLERQIGEGDSAAITTALRLLESTLQAACEEIVARFGAGAAAS
jgi:two-component system sensor histidine kinase/response regulator